MLNYYINFLGLNEILFLLVLIYLLFFQTFSLLLLMLHFFLFLYFLSFLYANLLLVIYMFLFQTLIFLLYLLPFYHMGNLQKSFFLIHYVLDVVFLDLYIFSLLLLLINIRFLLLQGRTVFALANEDFLKNYSLFTIHYSLFIATKGCRHNPTKFININNENYISVELFVY